MRLLEPQLVVVLSAFAALLGFGAIVPVLPVHVHDGLGQSTAMTGFMMGLASATALLSRVFAGPMADERGRKPVMHLGLMFCLLAGLFYLPQQGLWTLTLARLLHGAGEGFLLTAGVAWTVDLAPPHARAQRLGLLASGVWGGLSLGPVIGAMLGTMFHVGLFVAASVTPLVLLVFLLPNTKPVTGAKVEGGTAREESRLAKLFPRPALLPGVLLGLANFSWAALSGFLVLYLRHGSSPVNGTKVLSCFALTVLFGRTAMGSLPDRWGPRRTLLIGLSCIAAGLAWLAWLPWPVTAYGAAILIGTGYSFPWPSLAVIVTGKVPAETRASALGVLTAMNDLFVAVAGPLLGWVATHLGFPAVYASASAAACSGIAIVVWRRVGLRESPSA